MMLKQIEQIVAPNFSDTLTVRSNQELATGPSEIAFHEWTINSARLAAIKEVSTNIAGEIPAYEQYVTAKNAERGLDSELYVLRNLSHTPSAFNYQAKLNDALAKHEISLSVAA
jgi:hypothetical protein